jgi:hypothetical protein
MDRLMVGWKNDVISMGNNFNPVKAKSVVLDEIGFHVSAGILASDTEDQKRKKIESAVRNHRKEGEWLITIKPRIDLITGLNTVLFNPDLLPNWVLITDAVQNPLNYWASLGSDGLDNGLGIGMTGGNDYKGHVFIDFTANISAGELLEVGNIFRYDFNPAYLVIHLGYVTGFSYTQLEEI